MEMYHRIEAIVRDTLSECVTRGDLPEGALGEKVVVEKPKRAEHGDFATTVCLQLARMAKKSPRDVARSLLTHLVDKDGIVESCEVAGPGFVNFKVRSEVWREAVREVVREGPAFGRSDVGQGRRVLVEFVSANPTGPLHVGHARGAVLGDTVAALLDWTGFQVEREYYINDVGKQVDVLGRSLWIRYRQQCGHAIELPEKHYPGAYLVEIAKALHGELGDTLAAQDYEAEPEPFRSFAKARIIESIKKDLLLLGIVHDRWYSEQTLHEARKLHAVVERLRERGHIRTDEEGRQWFDSSTLGDDEDRVVMRGNGVPTYFAADIAYHEDKLLRSDHCINVWGADHHGYIARVKASLAALGYDPARLEILLYQFVNLVEGGQQVRMGKRGGVFETLADLIDEVGADATRFNLIARKADAQFEFDLGVAKQQSLDNPVYYVQYGHARICQILAKAAEAGIATDAQDVDLASLELPEELELIKKTMDLPWVVRSAAEARGPHHLVFYLQDLIGTFHAYYTKYKHNERVISDDATKTQARLYLCRCVRTVLANVLGLLKLTAPERMYFTE